MLAGGARRGLNSSSRSAIIASILIASSIVVCSEGRGGDAERKFIAPGKGGQGDKISQWRGGGSSNRGRARGTNVGKESHQSLHNTAPRYYHDGPWAERESSVSSCPPRDLPLHAIPLKQCHHPHNCGSRSHKQILWLKVTRALSFLQEVENEGISGARGPGMSSSRLRLRTGKDRDPGIDDSKRRTIEGGRKSNKQGGRLAIQEAGGNVQADETMMARQGRAGLRRKKSEREERSSSYETMSWSAHSQEDQSYHSDDDTDKDHDSDQFHDDDDDDDDDDDNGSETGGGASSEDEASAGGSQDSGSSIQESSSVASRLRRVEQRKSSGRGARKGGNAGTRRRGSVWHGKSTSEDVRGGRGGGGGGGIRDSPGSESSTGGGELLGSSSDDFGEGVGTSAMVVDARRRQRQRQRKGR